MASIEDVQCQSDTDKNEHLNNIVHEIIDNLELVDDRKDREEKENERSDHFLSIITSVATTDTQPEHKNEAELDEDNKATLIETYEPFNSPGPQNATNKNSESNQETRLSDLEVQNIDLSKTDEPSNSDFQKSESNQEIREVEVQNIELLEQVESHRTNANVAETIEDNNSVEYKDETGDNIENSYKTEINPEKKDLIDEKEKQTSQSQTCQILENKTMNKTSIFENHGLQFIMLIGNI